MPEGEIKVSIEQLLSQFGEIREGNFDAEFNTIPTILSAFFFAQGYSENSVTLYVTHLGNSFFEDLQIVVKSIDITNEIITIVDKDDFTYVINVQSNNN